MTDMSTTSPPATVATVTVATVTRIEPPDKLTQLRGRVLAINEDMSTDEVLAVTEAVDALYERVKEVRAMRDEAMVKYLQNRGDLTVGETVYTAGKEKRVKCRDNAAAFLAVADAAGGDIDAISDVLASGAWKYGATRALLGDEKFDEHFETTFTDVVKFKKLNTKFLKGRVAT